MRAAPMGALAGVLGAPEPMAGTGAAPAPPPDPTPGWVAAPGDDADVTGAAGPMA